MAPILLLFVLVTIVTGLMPRNYKNEEYSGSGSGISGDEETDDDGPENITEIESTVATHIGLNATDDNFFTPTPEYPPEDYIPPEGKGEPLVNTEEGFYIGSGDPDDEESEVQLLIKAFDIIHLNN
nr:protein E30 [Elephant endotheliotropic herpesvirus 1A]